MERHLYQQLLAWKARQDRKPLLLQGARQVGKTYVLRQFGEREYAAGPAMSARPCVAIASYITSMTIAVGPVYENRPPEPAVGFGVVDADGYDVWPAELELFRLDLRSERSLPELGV